MMFAVASLDLGEEEKETIRKQLTWERHEMGQEDLTGFITFTKMIFYLYLTRFLSY